MITIYFMPQEMVGDFRNDFAIVAENFNKYEVVATVDTDDLETAWCNTNSIEDHWHKNKLVSVVSNNQMRSSAVGDVFELNGVKHIVAGVGFVEFPQ